MQVDIAFDKENVTYEEAEKAVNEGKTAETKYAYICLSGDLYSLCIRDRFGGYCVDNVRTFAQAWDWLNRCEG